MIEEEKAYKDTIKIMNEMDDIDINNKDKVL